jgi:hypothetical protein
MAMIMITCPVTNRKVFTGVETDPASIALVPAINTPMTCPACGKIHIWSVLDAELAGEPAAQADVAAPELPLGLKQLSERIRVRGGLPPLRPSRTRAR